MKSNSFFIFVKIDDLYWTPIISNALGGTFFSSPNKWLNCAWRTHAIFPLIAAVVGVSTDLEAISKGLGYSSFADAVAAYNAQYGTNYSVEEAKESLGQ